MMKTTLFMLLMCIFLECSGAIIIIKGQPTSLEYRNEIYYLPQDYVISPETTNLFITMDGINHIICQENKSLNNFNDKNQGFTTI